MVSHPLHLPGAVIALSVLALYLLDVGTAQTTDNASVAFSCYQGVVQCTTHGQLPLESADNLSLLPCGSPVTAPPLTTIAEPTVTPAISPTKLNATLPVTEVSGVATTQSGSAPNVASCAVVKKYQGEKLTINSTWTANFTCLTSGSCQSAVQNGGASQVFCCPTSGCNNLGMFMKRSGANFATVAECLVGFQNSTVFQAHPRDCNGLSRYCINTTTNTGSAVSTVFSCGNTQTETHCGDPADACTQDDNVTVCCCQGSNCNRPSPLQIHVSPTPAKTPPYLVTKAQPQSKLVLAAIVAGSVTVGATAMIVVLVACRRWKLKHTNSPLNISYSRVSADLAEETDENVFSY